MAQFEDSGFFGISPRSIWLTLAVVGVVVGLYFIPGMIKGKIAGKRGQSSVKVAQVKQQPSRDTVPDERASLAPSALTSLSANISPKQQTERVEVKTPKKPTTADSNSSDEGFFSGLNFRVKAGVGGRSDTIGVPSGLKIDKLNTRAAQNFFRQGRSDLMKFINQSKFVPFGARDYLEQVVGGMDTVANGLPKEISHPEAGKQLQHLHEEALRALAASRADRGLFLEYLRIPAVRFIDQSTGSHTVEHLLPRFAPGLVLRSASLKQTWGTPGFAPGAMLSAELGVRGSDVDKVLVYAGSVKVGEYRGGNPDSTGFTSVRVQGDGAQVWTFVAYDKYGAKPFVKSYSFMPRARRFSVDRNGFYNIAFRPGSARNSLDRFFYAGGSKPFHSGDPAISTF